MFSYLGADCFCSDISFVCCSCDFKFSLKGEDGGGGGPDSPGESGHGTFSIFPCGPPVALSFLG